MLRRGDNSLTADRLRKAANSARGRRRKARGQRVLNVTVHFQRASEWLYGEGPGASSNDRGWGCAERTLVSLTVMGSFLKVRVNF
jgi:hypothetical protein